VDHNLEQLKKRIEKNKLQLEAYEKAQIFNPEESLLSTTSKKNTPASKLLDFNL